MLWVVLLTQRPSRRLSPYLYPSPGATGVDPVHSPDRGAQPGQGRCRAAGGSLSGGHRRGIR